MNTRFSAVFAFGRKLSLSVVIYAAGLASLLFADFLVINNLEPEQITDWAVFRSLVGIAAILPLAGLDQVLVRSPRSSARLLKILLVQVPIVGGALGVVIALLGFVPNWWTGAGLALGSALSLALFQYFRSHHHRVLSQISQQGWKIAALAFLFWLVWSGADADLLLSGVCLILLVNIIGLAALAHLRPGRLHTQNPEPAKDLYSIGLRFMVTAQFLALSVYAEQLVVNRLGSTEEAALYFAAATYLLFPASFCNGYIAFVIGPWIRDNHDRFLAALKKYRFGLLIGICVYAVVLSLIGWLGWILTSPAVGAFNHGLQLIFVVSVAMRTSYVIPSGYVGVFGTPRQHDALIASQALALAVGVALFTSLWGNGLELIYAVGAASAANLALRAITGYWVMALIARSRGAADEQ